MLRASTFLAALCLLPAGAVAQATGTILGRVVRADGEAIAAASVSVVGLPIRAATSEQGRFVLPAVPVGERSLRIELVGYRPLTLSSVRVRPGGITEVGPLVMQESPVALDPLVVEAERVRLVEPDVAVTHEAVVAAELRALPITTVEEAVELAAGVTDGHFRGGRIGQEAYVVDGVELKNPLEASTQGFGLEFSPTALEEVDVVTGGFGAEFGSALSGVVRYATRRGDPSAWEGRGGFLTDHWVPGDLFRGFAALSASAGGPLPFLGSGATVFGDVWLQGMLDADPRSRGATCLAPAELEPALAGFASELALAPHTRHLACPFQRDLIPHQQGDKQIGFLRLDQPLPGGVTLTATLLRNRLQRLLYTPEFKYNDRYQLGQRTEGTLGVLTAQWARPSGGWGLQLLARAVAMRLERHLGAVDLPAFRDRTGIAGFGLARMEFLGEDFVRRAIDEQLEDRRAVPGYLAPGGSTGSPFGPAAEGVFFTEGTPDLANWSRSELLGADVVAEAVSSEGSSFRVGTFLKSYRVEQYERTLAHLAGSVPNYARFYPASVSGFAEARLAAADEVTVQLGVRVDAFRPGLVSREDRADFLSPVLETEWQTSVSPRISLVGPVPRTDGRTALRFSYGLVSQPPDFRYFLDTSVGDSLRTDVRRQGNPSLAFERGSAWELGVEHLLMEAVAVRLTAFRKELTNLVTGSLRFQGTAPGEFTTGDFGEVKGLELTLRGRQGPLTARASYSLQKAEGVVSSALQDTLIDADRTRVLVPLAFDRRHAFDLALTAAGWTGWTGGVTASVRSGYPIQRLVAEGAPAPEDPDRLPWTALLDLRLSRELGRVPGCEGCRWSLTAEGRNVLGRDNVIALRRSTASLSPSEDEVLARMSGIPGGLIPLESPRYSALADLDHDGLITPEEYRSVRLAAVLDLFEPSLFYGEPRQLRLGAEVAF